MAITNKVIIWYTKKLDIKYRLNEGLRFLDTQKQKLNNKLYRTHFECAKQWHKLCNSIQTSSEYKLHDMNEALYDKLKRNYINSAQHEKTIFQMEPKTLF